MSKKEIEIREFGMGLKKNLRSNLINDSLTSVLENKEAHSHQEFPGVPAPVPCEEMLLSLLELSRKIEGPVLEGYSPWEWTVEATNVILDHECNTLFSFHNNVLWIRVTDDLWPLKLTICLLLYFQEFYSFTLLGLPQSRESMPRTWLRAAL